MSSPREFITTSPESQCPAQTSRDEITRILVTAEPGQTRVVERLLPLVYDELRRLAAAKLSHESADQTLQATALVHEA